MRKLAQQIHKWISWIAGLAIIVVIPWGQLDKDVGDWLVGQRRLAWSAMQDPWKVAGGLGLIVCYICLWFWTRHEPTSKDAKPIATITNSELRKLAVDRAEKIRVFARRVNLSLSKQEALESWQIRQDAIGKAYRSEHWPEARLVVVELRRRLGLPVQDVGSPAIDHGMLAGVHPLENAAILLDELANQLTD